MGAEGSLYLSVRCCCCMAASRVGFALLLVAARDGSGCWVAPAALAAWVARSCQRTPPDPFACGARRRLLAASCDHAANCMSLLATCCTDHLSYDIIALAEISMFTNARQSPYTCPTKALARHMACYPNIQQLLIFSTLCHGPK